MSQDAEGATVAQGVLAGQTEQAFLNVAGALAEPDYLIPIDATAVLP